MKHNIVLYVVFYVASSGFCFSDFVDPKKSNLQHDVRSDDIQNLIQDSQKYIENFNLVRIKPSILVQAVQGDKRAPRLIAEGFYEMGLYVFVYLADGSKIRLETATGKLRQVDTDDLLRLAARWYKIAASRGDGLAMRAMADIAEDYLGDHSLSYEEWMKRSFETLKNTAETSRELLFLTRCYGRGEGTSIDNSKAAETYLRYIERCKVEKKTGYVPPSNCMTPVPEYLKQYSSGEFTEEQLKAR